MKNLIQKYLPLEYKLHEIQIPKLEAHFIIETELDTYQITLDLTPDPDQSAELVATELLKTLWEIEPPEPKTKRELN